LKRLLTWLAARPLAVLLPLEALLLFWRLDLLSPWFDEADTLLFIHGPLAQAIAIPASGLHPPLYFLLLWCWMRLPLGLGWTVQGRTLSVLFTLGSTLAADRLWARRLTVGARWWFLALWTLSPFLLLYGRMSRSYSLQLLLGVTAAAYILRFAEKRSRGNFAMVCILLVVALYTHYVPGVALVAAANVLLARRGRWRDAAAIDGLTALALLPWMAWLIPQLKAWGAHHVGYALTGGTASELVLKLAYWAMSFTMGEAIPDPVLLLGALLVPLVLMLAFFGARRQGEIAWLAIPAAAIGFLGVTRWVAYPFIPARMIFCFPLFVTFLMAGAAAYRRAGVVARWGMLAASLSGIWCYFHLEGFRNKQYPLPMAEIGARIRAGSTGGHAAVLVDSSNSDVIGLHYALGDAPAPLATEDPGASAMVDQWLADPGIRTIWFLRNTHDVSPGALDAHFAAQLGARMQVTTYSYEPFTPLELRLMGALGMRDPPRYFHELLQFQR
jgi:hypothetical protein